MTILIQDARALESKTTEEISRAAFSLLLKEPFYAHVLHGVEREVSARVETIGASLDGPLVRLTVNGEYFLDTLGAEERCAVLKHEILHLVFQHICRCGNRDARIYSIAADLVVNQLIRPWRLPAGYPTLADFPDLDLQPDKSADEYYAVLIEMYHAMRQAGFDGGKDNKENQSVATTRLAQSTKAPRSAAALARFLEKVPFACGDDRGWHDGEGGNGTVARYAMENLLLRARERVSSQQWGCLPAGVLSQLNLILSQRQPQVDWKRTLRIFCGSSGRTRIRHTVKRISKRYGTRPGIKIQRLQRLLVALDTSGSISDSDLQAFFAEIHAIWKVGANVVVVECDADVQRSYEYRGEAPKAVAGRGGTAFEPVFRWMREQRPFDGCIYLTDGYGSSPDSRPTCKLLWVLSAQGTEAQLRFGPAIRISNQQEYPIYA